LKRDTRHARRRASLAISSNVIPADSLAAAPHCHARVIMLSTEVMHFDMVSAPRWAARQQTCAIERAAQRHFRVNDAPTRLCALSRPSTACARNLHQFTTKPRIVMPKVRVR
jgi:hypothetical protein